MSEATTDPGFTAAIEAAFTAVNERRFADFVSSMTEDLVVTYPQSGERIEGRDQLRRVFENSPSPPTFTVRSVHRTGDLAVAELDERFEDGSLWAAVLIFELRGGMIATLTGYFGEPFAAPEWRRPFRVAP